MKKNNNPVFFKLCSDRFKEFERGEKIDHISRICQKKKSVSLTYSSGAWTRDYKRLFYSEKGIICINRDFKVTLNQISKYETASSVDKGVTGSVR